MQGFASARSDVNKDTVHESSLVRKQWRSQRRDGVMNQSHKPTVIITGASSGVGLYLLSVSLKQRPFENPLHHLCGYAADPTRMRGPFNVAGHHG
jgi:hypothetical protein